MPTFYNQTLSSFWNRILQINQSGNNNVDSTTRTVQSGGGVDTAISLSDDVLQVQPQADDTTATLLCKTNGGSNVFTVDTTNKRVLCGSSQINALTQYQTFNNNLVTPAIGYHMVIAPSAVEQSSASVVEWSLGNGADPATTLDVSAETTDTNNLAACYWYLPDAITIMSAHILMASGTAADSALNFHLTSYDMDTSSNYGDLSNGVVIADSGSTTAVDEDVIKLNAMTNLPTDVAAGKVILATVESDATNVIAVNMTVKYHIQ